MSKTKVAIIGSGNIGTDLMFKILRTSEDLEALAIDPQTSGGLLASVDADDAAALVAEGWWRVGEVVDGRPRVELL